MFFRIGSRNPNKDKFEKWIIETKRQCPHCRAHLHVQDLIKFPWADEVTQHIDNLKNFQSDTIEQSVSSSLDRTCPDHKGQHLSVFCTSCDRPICHYCALFASDHKGHSFCPLTDAYTERVECIRSKLGRVKQRYAKIDQTVNSLESNIRSVGKAREERIQELNCAVEQITRQLESRVESRIALLDAQKWRLSEITTAMEKVLHDTHNELTSKSKEDFVLGSNDLVAKIDALEQQLPEDSSSFDLIPVACDFPSELTPPYDSGHFRVRNFSRLRLTGHPVYSRPLNVGGLTWRLKVYPDGNGVVVGKYLSVFLELSTGLLEPSEYEYRIELIHRSSQNPGRNIVREFSSHFEVGECWGYNRFFRLDLLETEGYLDRANDMLVLEFHVRALNYRQKCRDLQWHIDQMEAKRDNQLLKLSQIRSLVSHELKNEPTRSDPSSSTPVLESTIRGAVTQRQSQPCSVIDVTTLPSTSRVPHQRDAGHSLGDDTTLRRTSNLLALSPLVDQLWLELSSSNSPSKNHHPSPPRCVVASHSMRHSPSFHLNHHRPNRWTVDGEEEPASLPVRLDCSFDQAAPVQMNVATMTSQIGAQGRLEEGQVSFNSDVDDDSVSLGEDEDGRDNFHPASCPPAFNLDDDELELDQTVSSDDDDDSGDDDHDTVCSFLIDELDDASIRQSKRIRRRDLDQPQRKGPCGSQSDRPLSLLATAPDTSFSNAADDDHLTSPLLNSITPDRDPLIGWRRGGLMDTAVCSTSRPDLATTDQQDGNNLLPSRHRSITTSPITSVLDDRRLASTQTTHHSVAIDGYVDADLFLNSPIPDWSTASIGSVRLSSLFKDAGVDNNW